jgi:protein ImuB
VRVVAVFIPHFPVVAHRRREAELRRRPVALVAGAEGRAAVVACSPDAARRGVAPGMSGAAARAACAETAVLPLDLDYCRAEHCRVREALLSVAPHVEDESLGCWCFHAEGLGRLYGGERGLVDEARRRVRGAGYASRAVVASGRFAAVAAARYGRAGASCVPAGREAGLLAPLPLEAAPLATEARRRLHLLGVRTLGQFARLPEDAVRARFGVEGAHAHRLARGLDPLPLAAAAAPSLAEAGGDLDPPGATLDEVLFRVRVLCDRVIGDLGARGLACWEARLELALDGAQPVEVRVRLTRPTLAPRTLWTLLRLRLEQVTLEGPVTAARLAAVDAPPARPEQRALFHARASAERLEAVVERLRARFGPEGAVSPLLVETHRPEGRLRWRGYDVGGGPAAAPEPAAAGRVLRIVSPPEPLGAREQLGRVVCFSGTGLDCQVARISQPYRVSGEWWRDEYARDYYIVLSREGRLLWIFRDQRSGEWFVQGEFD